MTGRIDVVIVGAGIMGVSTAYHLARRRIGRVVIVERDGVCTGSTALASGGIRHQYANRIGIELTRQSIEKLVQVLVGGAPELERDGPARPVADPRCACGSSGGQRLEHCRYRLHSGALNLCQRYSRVTQPATKLAPPLGAEDRDGIGRGANGMAQDFQDLQFLCEDDALLPSWNQSDFQRDLLSPATGAAVYLCPHRKQPHVFQIAARRVCPALGKDVVNIDIFTPFGGRFYKAENCSRVPYRAILSECWRSPHDAGVTRIVGDEHQRLRFIAKYPWIADFHNSLKTLSRDWNVSGKN
jgi:glycine/D-amino acid oxidase-like deaminating enzyme